MHKALFTISILYLVCTVVSFGGETGIDWGPVTPPVEHQIFMDQIRETFELLEKSSDMDITDYPIEAIRTALYSHVQLAKDLADNDPWLNEEKGKESLAPELLEMKSYSNRVTAFRENLSQYERELKIFDEQYHRFTSTDDVSVKYDVRYTIKYTSLGSNLGANLASMILYHSIKLDLMEYQIKFGFQRKEVPAMGKDK